MKIKRATKLFLNEAKLLAAITTGKDLNKPVGFVYCDEQDEVSCAVFLGTDRETGELHRTKGGDLQLNIKIDSARKKGEQVADKDAAEAPLDDQEAALVAARAQAAEQAGLAGGDDDIPL